MSRLFSRLENIGQDQNEGTPPAESARQADAHADAAFPAGFGDTPITGATLPNPAGMPPPVPGYSIPSSLARSPLPPAAVIARPAWTVRLWLASLLLLIGLSLLLLALPERLLPTAPQQRPAGAAPEVSA